MLFFLNIPEKGCISGIGIPSLATHMGRLGALNESFPGFGGTRRKDWRRVERFRPMLLSGVLSIGANNLQLKESQLNLDENDPSRVARMRGAFGCTATSEAQTYYYYPSSGTNAPGVTAAPTTAPTYYYRRGLFGRVCAVDVFSSVLPDSGGASGLPARCCSPVSSRPSLPLRRYAGCSCFL